MASFWCKANERPLLYQWIVGAVLGEQIHRRVGGVQIRRNRRRRYRTGRREIPITHYVTNILQKLQVRSRVEAALFAARHEK